MSVFNLGVDYDDSETLESKRRRVASTPEVDYYVGMSPSPSFSSVYEFPLSGECVDRTIEIGSNGDECSAEEPMMFPSEDEHTIRDSESEDSAGNSDSDGIIYPSDLEVHNGSDSSSAIDVDIVTGVGMSTISQFALPELQSSQDV
jgi:hypothetical protein